MLIKELPKKIQELVYKEAINDITQEDDIGFSAVLDWGTTKDGFSFWHMINKKIYSEFEKKYGPINTIDSYSII